MFLCVQKGKVIDKVMVIKDKHGAGLYDCHEQQDQLQRRRSFQTALRYNSPAKPDKL